MKFASYRKLLTRNFAPEYHIFTRFSERNVLQGKDLGVASGLHPSKTWEELAEDPFRGLRAGPADFSPSLFCTSADGVPEASEYTKPSKHPELPNTAEVCAGSLK